MAGAWANPVQAADRVAAPGNLHAVAGAAAPQAPLAQVALPLPPAPINLRLAGSASDCAAAAGSAACDAILKAEDRALIFHWTGEPAIDGYRLYANVGGKPVLQETSFVPDRRIFAIPVMSGATGADYCFQVRAFSGERESWPTNTVCVDAPAPSRAPAPALAGGGRVLAPSGGTLITGVDTYKNYNAGCSFPQRTIQTRSKSAFRDSVSAGYVLRDAKDLCGERSLIWNEGSVEFTLSELPARFSKATLTFISREGGANPACIREIFAYNLAIQNKSPGGERYEKLGDPLAWLTYHKTATIATAARPEGRNAYDVTAVLRQSILRKHKKQGFNFAVNQAMMAGNAMCAAGFKAFTLEIE